MILYSLNMKCLIILQNKAITTWPNCVKYEVSQEHFRQIIAILLWNVNTLSFADCFLIDLLQNPLMLLEMPQGGPVVRIFLQQSLVLGIIMILTKYWWYQRIRAKSCLWQNYDFDKISAVSISSSLIFDIIMILTKHWCYKKSEMRANLDELPASWGNVIVGRVQFCPDRVLYHSMLFLTLSMVSTLKVRQTYLRVIEGVLPENNDVQKNSQTPHLQLRTLIRASLEAISRTHKMRQELKYKKVWNITCSTSGEQYSTVP